MNGYTLVYCVAGVAAVVLACLVRNVMRCATDAMYGTSAHVNFSQWCYFLCQVEGQESLAAGISGSALPLRVSAEQLGALGRAHERRSGSAIELPHLEDPWGHPVIITLLSEAPKLKWRVSCHVGRSFFGSWADKTVEIESWSSEDRARVAAAKRHLSQPRA